MTDNIMRFIEDHLKATIITIVVVGISAAIIGGIIQTKEPSENKTIIVPNVVKCEGQIEREHWARPFPKKLICNDGRVFHAIQNYQIIYH